MILLDKGIKPPKDYQYDHLHFVYAIKPDLLHKSCLVCNGSTIDPSGLSTRTAVKHSFNSDKAHTRINQQQQRRR